MYISGNFLGKYPRLQKVHSKLVFESDLIANLISINMNMCENCDTPLESRQCRDFVSKS